MNPDDIIIWFDDTWCYRKRAGDLIADEGEYIVLYADTKAHKDFLTKVRALRTPTWSLIQ